MFWNRKPKPAKDAESPGNSAREGGDPGTGGSSWIVRAQRDELLDAIDWVSTSTDIESMLLRIVDSAVKVARAERGLLIQPGQDGELEVRIARTGDKQNFTGELRYSTRNVREVMRSGQSMMVHVPNDEQALALGSSIHDLRLRAVMCVPLVFGARVAGSRLDGSVLYVDSRVQARKFSADDLQAFEALAGLMRVALEKQASIDAMLEKERMVEERRIMAEIQRDLMPSQAPARRGWELHAWYRPAEETSGDFYDFIPMSGERLGLAVGDASGHGVGPALIAASTQAALRSILGLTSDLQQAITVLNHDVSARVRSGRFCTLHTSILEPDGSVWMLNAGHPAAILWRASSSNTELFESNGPGLGMLEDHSYTESVKLRLETGDLLVILSDGITETAKAQDRSRLYDVEGVREFLAERASANLPLKSLREQLVESLARFSGGVQADDMTILLARKVADR